MVRPEDAANKLRKHFKEVSPEDFAKRLEQSRLPIVLDSESLEENSMTQLTLYHRPSSVLPLNAYLASALTGLAGQQRDRIFEISDIVSECCAAVAISVYEPRKNTDPVKHSDISGELVFKTDREKVLTSDLLILLTEYPSFGAGQELDFALNALLPILIISPGDHVVSRMVTGTPALKGHLTYVTHEDLRRCLKETLEQLRPILEQRKLSFAKYHVNIVGNRIRELREELQLTREDVASSVPQLTPELLKQIEESPDHTANPSLIHLREIATILKTTVADLVEPNLEGRLIMLLEDWISGRQAARFGEVNIKDRNRILRKILYRYCDSLEED